MPKDVRRRGQQLQPSRRSFRDLHADQRKRKQQILTHPTPSTSRDIADAIVVKNEDLFFLAQPDGDVPLKAGHGLGLYYHDCRFLNGYELTVNGAHLEGLAANESRGFTAAFELTNPDIAIDGRRLAREQIGVHWRRVLACRHLVLRDRLRFVNYTNETVRLPVELRFRAGFEDVFKVRGLLDEQPGRLHAPAWDVHGHLCYGYDGADGIARRLAIAFSPNPAVRRDDGAEFVATLGPREVWQLHVSLSLTESRQAEARAAEPAAVDIDHMLSEMSGVADRRMPSETQVHSDSLLVQAVLDRSLRDLHMLQTDFDQLRFFAAGVPWFVTLFGRDSLLSALQVLPFSPDIAGDTLRLLARHQGKRDDPWRDEQPGKILHEFRAGELARTNAIPYTPYYGSVDATALFLILLAEHVAWTGDLGLFHELRDNIERALAWISDYGDLDGDGYVEYESDVQRGLINQGWKDSGDAIVNSDGTLARPPIALIEVQAYVYRAWREIAALFRATGEPARAAGLEGRAEAMRTRFNRDYWLEEEGHYALALQAGKAPVRVMTSNPGHALWTGIADVDKARKTAERLMAEDMFSGWGVRTLSTRAARYNPVGYHLGTVWPHDNALILAGLRRYGHDDEAVQIMTGVMEAAMSFAGYRLPELFAGFARSEYEVPVRYPVANHPQAWAASAVLYMVRTLLGLEADGLEQRLRIVRPVMPAFVHNLEVRGLRVGKGVADLRFERRNGRIETKVLRVDGALDVDVERGL